MQPSFSFRKPILITDDSVDTAETTQISSSTVIDEARVIGNAIVVNSYISGGHVFVGGDSKITNCVMISTPNSSQGKGINIYDKATVTNLRIKGNCEIFGNAKLELHVDALQQLSSTYFIVFVGNCKFWGDANFRDIMAPEDFVKKYGADKVKITEDSIILNDIWDEGSIK